MSWQKEVDEINKRRALARRMGGEAGVARQHAQGKLTVRERIEKLLDPGSFREWGALAGSVKYDENGELAEMTPANVVGGVGEVEARRVVVSGEDYTIRGGSSEATNPDKWQWLEVLAAEMQIPLIRLVDMAGGSVKLLDKAGATKLPGYTTIDQHDLMGLIPIAAAALGAVAGLGAARVVGSHFSVMVRNTSQIFAAGPPVVTPATGEKLTKEELGGYKVHARGSGVADNEAESEEDALEQIRRFLSYLPSNCYRLPPVQPASDDPGRQEEELIGIIPRNPKRVYNARRIVELVMDQGSVFELGRHNGASVIAALARLDGRPVGVMANDPYIYGGGMDAGAAEKMIRFVDMCDSFHLPIVNFVDQPGVVIGLAAEKAGTIRKALRALAAVSQSQVPWAAVIVRRCFGVAGSSYGRLHDLNLKLAWPSATWGSIPIEGGVYAAYRKEIEAAGDPQARLNELEGHYRKLASPFRTAEKFGVQEIIDPRKTRALLTDWVNMAYEVLPGQLGLVKRAMRM